jgi:hypothetical protein
MGQEQETKASLRKRTARTHKKQQALRNFGKESKTLKDNDVLNAYLCRLSGSVLASLSDDIDDIRSDTAI